MRLSHYNYYGCNDAPSPQLVLYLGFCFISIFGGLDAWMQHVRPAAKARDVLPVNYAATYAECCSCVDCVDLEHWSAVNLCSQGFCL